METLKIADKTFTSRLFTGTGKFSSNQVMEEAIIASESQLVTVAMKRIRMEDITQHLRRTGCQGSHFCRSIIPGSFRYQLAETGNSSRSPLSAARSGRNPESHRRTG